MNTIVTVIFSIMAAAIAGLMLLFPTVKAYAEDSINNADNVDSIDPLITEKQEAATNDNEFVRFRDFIFYLKSLAERVSETEDRIEDLFFNTEVIQDRQEKTEDRVAFFETQNVTDPYLLQEKLTAIEKELQKTNHDFSLSSIDNPHSPGTRNNSSMSSNVLFPAGRFLYLGPLARSEIESSLTDNFNLSRALDDLYLQTKGFFFYKNREYSEQINLELHMLEANVYARQFQNLTYIEREAIKKWILCGHSVSEPCDTPFGTAEDIITASKMWDDADEFYHSMRENQKRRREGEWSAWENPYFDKYKPGFEEVDSDDEPYF